MWRGHCSSPTWFSAKLLVAQNFSDMSKMGNNDVQVPLHKCYKPEQSNAKHAPCTGETCWAHTPGGFAVECSSVSVLGKGRCFTAHVIVHTSFLSHTLSCKTSNTLGETASVFLSAECGCSGAWGTYPFYAWFFKWCLGVWGRHDFWFSQNNYIFRLLCYLLLHILFIWLLAETNQVCNGPTFTSTWPHPEKWWWDPRVFVDLEFFPCQQLISLLPPIPLRAPYVWGRILPSMLLSPALAADGH